MSTTNYPNNCTIHGALSDENTRYHQGFSGKWIRLCKACWYHGIKTEVTKD